MQSNTIHLLVVTNSLLIVARKFCLLGEMSELNRTQFDFAHRVVVVFGENLAERRERSDADQGFFINKSVVCSSACGSPR